MAKNASFSIFGAFYMVISTETKQKLMLTRYIVCQLQKTFPIVAAGWSANLFS